jgi:hypothetical protein
MYSSALKLEEYCQAPTPLPTEPDGPSALEVCASYHGVLIGARYLDDVAPKRRRWPSHGLDPCASYTIGQSPRADAPAPSEVIGGADLPLVCRVGRGYLINVTPQMTGDVVVGGKVYRLADYLAGRGTSFTLPPAGRARIDCGAMRFQLAPTTRTNPLPKRWLNWRWDELRWNLGALVVLGIFLLMIFAIPPQGATVTRDDPGMTRAFIPFNLAAPELPEVPRFLTKSPSPGAGEPGKAHAGPSGKMGDKNSQKPSGRYAVKGEGQDMHLGRAEAEAAIRDKGILGLLKDGAKSPFASILGRGTAVGDAKEDIMGNLLAANLDNGYGAGGWDVTGTGLGGGGFGEGTLGLGNFNTLGGSGYGHGPGTGLGKLAQRRPLTPEGPFGQVTVKGSLDKEIIRRVVRLHMNEVKYCYDHELLRKPSLGGRISLQFIISGTGQVISSFVQSTTMNDLRVEGCVAGAVRRWAFPKPTGAGIAIVSYPFNFVAAGGNN